MNGAMDVRRVRSSSTTGFSVVWVEFDWGTGYLPGSSDRVRKTGCILGESLPENVGKPTLGPQSSILGEMMIPRFDRRFHVFVGLYVRSPTGRSVPVCCLRAVWRRLP